MMSATTLAVLPAPMCFRALQWLKNKAYASTQSFETVVALNRPAMEELNWWTFQLQFWNGKPILAPTPDITIESDALLLGWGAALGTISSRGLWSEEERTQHINMLELMGGAFATRTFTKGKQNVHVRLRMDNTTAIAYVNHMGGTKSQSLSQAACKIMAVVPTERHYSSSRAPTRIMQHIGRLRVEDAVDVGQLNLWQSTTEVGACSIDLFASRLNNQLPRYASWHPDPFAVETDAFQMSWIGK